MPTQPYKHNDGKRVPSVTTIISRFKESGALINWSNNLATDVLKESLNLLTEAQAALDFQQPYPPLPTKQYLQTKATKQKLTWYKILNFLGTNPTSRADSKQYVKEAATAGSICHDLVENWLLAVQTLPDRKAYKPPTSGQLQRQHKITKDLADMAAISFGAFLTWVDQTKFHIVETEMPLVSQQFRFGGCPDCLTVSSSPLPQLDQTDQEESNCIDGIHPGLLQGYDLFDWKTSGRIYADYLLQLAAYRLLIEESAYCQSCFSSPEEYQTNRFTYDIQTDCIACEGTGKSSRGRPCVPCKGMGKKETEVDYRGEIECQTCYGYGTTKPIQKVHCVRFDKVSGEPEIKSFNASDLATPLTMFLNLRKCYEYDKEVKKILKKG